MPTFPLATLAAQVSPTGITAPSYSDIYQSLQASFKSIYGSDAYIEPDSQDGQFMAVFAKALDDSNKTAIAVYNNYSPATAQGTGLSSAVKMNGIRRLVATQSTVTVTLVGQAGTVITNGLVSDANATHQWALPASVTIPGAGTIDVIATCVDYGTIPAPAGFLTQIVTPTRGWQTVTNAADAVQGAPVESDASLRRRQSAAAALAANNNVGALIAGVAQVTGVTGIAVQENFTGATDASGVPAHSIALVVLGGLDTSIASMLALKKSDGCGTFGTTSVHTVDPNGIPLTVQFSRPVNQPAAVVLNVTALAGFSSNVVTAIQNAIASYINALGIGEDLIFNRLWVPANLVGSAYAGTFQIQSMTLNGGTADIITAYNQVIVSSGVTVNQV